MSEPYADLGGQTSRPAPRTRVQKPAIPKHVCNHPDGHVCPWLNEVDARGHAQRCSCRPEQTALVDYSDPGVPKVAPAPRGRAKIVWTKYDAVKPYKCDHCQLALWTLKGVGPLARSAKYKRVCGDDVMYLCDAHKQDQRLADGLPVNLHDRKKA